MAPGGYFGQALVVDIDGMSATAAPLRLEAPVLRAYLGGVGLGTWLLHRLAPPLVDPLAPEAPLAFVFSPLVGTPLTTSAKFAVVAKLSERGPGPIREQLRRPTRAARRRRRRARRRSIDGYPEARRSGRTPKTVRQALRGI